LDIGFRLFRMHAPSPASVAVPGRYHPAIHRYACFCTGGILFLIILGSLVTSNEAGMSVPDWPTTYGQNMFTFPWQDWVGGILYEHSHRLVAFGISTLTIILSVALFFQERIWLRWMGAFTPVFFLLEGTIGGLRVILSKDQLGIVHGCLAQLLFLTVALIALFTSRWWIETPRKTLPPQWTGRVAAISGLIFVQLAIGATMRHDHAGLSIDDFPLAYGQAWPKTDSASVAAYNQERLARTEHPTSAFYILLQMAHRIGAVLITLCIVAEAISARLARDAAAELRKWSAVWVALVLVQVVLGAFTIWSGKQPHITTTHVVVGALTLMTGALLTAMGARLGRTV
jgi:cytochrome c oxidase assembly protein subunit 15